MKINFKARGTDYDWRFVYLSRQKLFSFFVYVNYANSSHIVYPETKHFHFHFHYHYHFSLFCTCAKQIFAIKIAQQNTNSTIYSNYNDKWDGLRERMRERNREWETEFYIIFIQLKINNEMRFVSYHIHTFIHFIRNWYKPFSHLASV